MRIRRYADRTPRLITAKYPQVCACRKLISTGDEALYYPASKTLECRECAVPTLQALADERNMSNA